MSGLQPPLGIRNKNPGNIRSSKTPWLGQTAVHPGNYVIFSDAVYGIRAMAKLLINYQIFYGLDTIKKIISRWAPPVGPDANDTDAYIKDVCNRLIMTKDHPFSIKKKDNIEFLVSLIDAIIWHENGQNPYSREFILRGASMAFPETAKTIQ
jgi:hypothetical protein